METCPLAWTCEARGKQFWGLSLPVPLAPGDRIGDSLAPERARHPNTLVATVGDCCMLHSFTVMSVKRIEQSQLVPSR